MKYLKRIFEATNFSTMTDEELEEKLHWLRTEYNEIFSEMSLISSIINSRKEASEEKLTKDWPKSIFDLNKSQLDWVLNHGPNSTGKHYEISNSYLRQLRSVVVSGFNPDTNQFNFNICTDYWMDPSGIRYTENEEAIKNLEFLIDILKPINIDGENAVKFGVLFTYRDEYNYSLLYFRKDKVTYGSVWQDEKKSLKEAIKELVNYDISGNEDE